MKLELMFLKVVGKSLIPEGTLPNGSIYTVATNPDTSHKGLLDLIYKQCQVQVSLIVQVLVAQEIKEEIKEGFKLYSNKFNKN